MNSCHQRSDLWVIIAKLLLLSSGHGDDVEKSVLLELWVIKAKLLYSLLIYEPRQANLCL